MTPAELQATLAKMPARSAQVLSHRLLDDKSPADCAALYGLDAAHWDLLFQRAVADFERALGSPAALELEALQAHRAEVKALIQKAHQEYEASPAYATETWLRRIAIIVIVALTAYFWWRDKQNEKPVPYAPYLTQPKKP